LDASLGWLPSVLGVLSMLCERDLFQSILAIFPFSLRNLPSRFLERSAQEKLDLAVQAAQIVVCPALNGLEHVAVYPQKERLTVRHGERLLVDRAGIDDRLR
jgi:hypothetical protein